MVGTEGGRFPGLYDAFPALAPFYTEYEKKWELTWETDFAQRSLPHVCVLSMVYCALCFLGKYLMKDRKPFDLKGPLAMWNLFLAIFSFCGAIRNVPHLIYSLSTRGVYYTICEDCLSHYGHGASGFWGVLFVFSKIPELFDTVFIILRKKPLLFLHYYHHITVLLYSWKSFSTLASSGIYFVSMNYTVHAVMYFYYFLAAIGRRPHSWARFVTILQLSQMAVGVAVCGSSLVYRYHNIPCATTDESLKWGILMYSSYFALFFKFFIDRYLVNKAKKAQ